MFSEILVPLDGGKVAEEALDVAAAIARRHGSRVHLVGVSRPVVLMGGIPLSPEIPVTASAELDRIAQEQLESYLEDHATRLGRSGQPVRSAVMSGVDTVGDQLLHYATRHNIDLIVMHTHARGAVRRFWLGSVASALVQKSGVPCLLLRGPGPASARPILPVSPQRILVPLDGSREAELAVDFALACAVPEHTEIELLCVVAPLPFPGSLLEGASIDDRRAAAARYLARVGARVTEADVLAHSHVVVHQSPPTAIIEQLEERGADLLVMAAHFRSEANRIFLGSVMDRLLRKTRIPMLVWRSKELAGTALLPVRDESEALAVT
jgi:nucleotide-binding universal stress UspA family protein